MLQIANLVKINNCQFVFDQVNKYLPGIFK